MNLRRLCFWSLAFVALLSVAFAGAADDWGRIIALDAGPGATPKSAQEAKDLALAHSAKQEKALRAFLEAHPADEHAFEARLRLARVLGVRANMNNEPQPVEAMRLLLAAEGASATREQHAEVDFAKLAQRMRQSRGKRPTREEREDLLKSAREFAHDYPADHRVAALLLEVSTLFDGDAKTKTKLLADARRATKDPGLLAQIADDSKRLGWLGQKLPLHFTAVDGTHVDIKDWRGRPVVLVFFATTSSPARAVFAEMNRLAAAKNAAFVAVSLDADANDVARFIATMEPRPAVAWDGKGWDGPFVQALGINAVPTVWLLDPQGVIRTLDPLDDPEGLLGQLMR